MKTGGIQIGEFGMVNKDYIEAEFKVIKKMTAEYQNYIAFYGKGGDWTMENFMRVINTKIARIEREM